MSRSVLLACALVSVVALGCRDDSGGQQQHDGPIVTPHDGGQTDTGTTNNDGSSGYTFDSVKGLREAPPATQTVVTINTAVVTALAGNYKTAYIEDAAGGAKSGIALYCNFTSTSQPCPVTRDQMSALKPGQQVKVVGTYDVYNGKLEVKVTAIEVLNGGAIGSLPPVADVPAADIDTGVNVATPYDYAAVLVNVSNTPFTVNSLTPDGFANSSYQPDCSMGPAFSAYQVTDGTSHINVTTNFYRSTDLASDPNCIIIYDGGTPSDTLVTMGGTFTKLGGIPDVDPYAQKMTLQPVAYDGYTYVPSTTAQDGGQADGQADAQ